ncbi:expansin-A18-like [Actinidia eriantha]|uniref:expansin-A18-like n=1 Tax=Actinidia eriantha TaxID=165200 RepID=UPI0025878BE9|nr:expansin-A18-like [Actinidia eriantha]
MLPFQFPGSLSWAASPSALTDFESEASIAFQFHFHMVCRSATHIAFSSIDYKLHCERLFDLECRMVVIVMYKVPTTMPCLTCGTEMVYDSRTRLVTLPEGSKACLEVESLEGVYNTTSFRVSCEGGACGYGNLFNTGYGTDTAALSSTLFNNGYACGSCYQIKCVQSPGCFAGYPLTTVTATNLCPPNWAQDSNNGGWCNPPRTHFDMSKPAFMKIAQWKAGIVPVMYRRVPCVRQGGLQFAFQVNGYWLLVYVVNVGGGGDVSGMWVKGTETGWISMSHNWGASYQAFATLSGQALSFKVTSYTTKQTLIAYNVAPSNWNVGMTYKANVNFH